MRVALQVIGGREIALDRYDLDILGCLAKSLFIFFSKLFIFLFFLFLQFFLIKIETLQKILFKLNSRPNLCLYLRVICLLDVLPNMREPWRAIGELFTVSAINYINFYLVSISKIVFKFEKKSLSKRFLFVLCCACPVFFKMHRLLLGYLLPICCTKRVKIGLFYGYFKSVFAFIISSNMVCISFGFRRIYAG